MKLAIADPPYPPFIGSGGRKNRASRWYGTGQRALDDLPADYHPEASAWDNPETHRALLKRLIAEYDGFAIATTPDGLYVYGELPVGARLMSWVKPNAMPGAHRLRSMWEVVILYPPVGRRSNRGVGSVPDVLTAPVPRGGFKGAKPEAWVHWVLDALSFDATSDAVDDLFPGSGGVERAIVTYSSRFD